MWTDQWTVQSDSKTGVEYKVSLDQSVTPPKWGCSCPSGKYRGHCKHIDRVKAAQESSRQQFEKVTNLNKLGIPPMPEQIPDSVLDDLL